MELLKVQIGFQIGFKKYTILGYTVCKRKKLISNLQIWRSRELLIRPVNFFVNCIISSDKEI